MSLLYKNITLWEKRNPLRHIFLYFHSFFAQQSYLYLWRMYFHTCIRTFIQFYKKKYFKYQRYRNRKLFSLLCFTGNVIITEVSFGYVVKSLKIFHRNMRYSITQCVSTHTHSRNVIYEMYKITKSLWKFKLSKCQ